METKSLIDQTLAQLITPHGSQSYAALDLDQHLFCA
jgi:hypothetical protein